ncbi:MAG: tRNA 2-thiouridine(34) synthase MnmA [Dehalococcoidia bacterium]|nr:tRNA 2-thiouridine(34) synthase MnmA [Dehalococcoidia bacterium]
MRPHIRPDPLPPGTRVVVGMSGGVDSATTAALLQRSGMDVIGVTMRLWAEEDPTAFRRQRHCCSVEDHEDARAAAAALGIPHYLANFEAEFERHVIDYFVDEYARGRTPNPCVVCNEEIKFRALLDYAHGLGASYLATGHYARIEAVETGYRLLRPLDEEKDQTYFLYGLGQSELSRVLFPLGGMTKPEVRALAAEIGLHLAQKADSADICFVPEGDHRAFLGDRLGLGEGPVLDGSGREIGRHHGAAGFTIGQRRGLGVATGERVFVTTVDVAANAITVGHEDDLLADRLEVEQARFVSGVPIATPARVEARLRYRAAPVAALLRREGGRWLVDLDRPQRAIAAGQAAVFYAGDEVIGGGTISRAWNSTRAPAE